ncbi:MAG: peptidoglycan DD-metalloendopeptidase family protein [Dysgonamonadaceae bacterium]|jgi:septal ring factor EnvC (AmiA/AmiB activator)|nr:peptidoglycan DD-metalloendopeptidase family protein [Dysgonamonadaceae bacterium]
MKKIAAIFALYLLSASFASMAQTTPQIEALKKKRLLLQKEITTTNKLFLDVKKQTNTVLQRINLINKQIDMRKEMISVQQKEIEALNNELSNMEKEINQLNVNLKQKQDSYAKAIRGMLKSRQTENKLFFVLSGKSLGESIRRMQYLREYSDWQKSKAEDIKQQKKLLSEKKTAMANTKTEKQTALASLQQEQDKLVNEETTKKAEMASAQGKQKELQKILTDKRKQADQLNNQIERMIADEVARQERQRIAREKAEAERRRKKEEAEAKALQEKESREKAAKDSNSRQKDQQETAQSAKKETSAPPQPRVAEDPQKETYTASAESFNLSKNFAANKGKLPMPVTGSASIVGNFGVNKHSEWNISTNSNGIDIQTQRGSNIRSVFDGEVSKVFSAPGANTCIIVRHGEYYTFYSNIYDLYVKQGDRVKTGQSLGRIFTDPDTGISTMHFQLWQKTAKLNPAPWLRR